MFSPGQGQKATQTFAGLPLAKLILLVCSGMDGSMQGLLPPHLYSLAGPLGPKLATRSICRGYLRADWERQLQIQSLIRACTLHIT